MTYFITETFTMMLSLAILECIEIDPQLNRLEKILEQSFIQRNLRDLEIPRYLDTATEKTKKLRERKKPRAPTLYNSNEISDYNSYNSRASYRGPDEIPCNPIIDDLNKVPKQILDQIPWIPKPNSDLTDIHEPQIIDEPRTFIVVFNPFGIAPPEFPPVAMPMPPFTWQQLYPFPFPQLMFEVQDPKEK